LAVKQKEAYVADVEKARNVESSERMARREAEVPLPTRPTALKAGGKKLALLVAAKPEAANFRHGLKVAEAALAAGAEVYLYCIDDAVAGAGDPLARELAANGMRFFACAESAQRRRLPMTGPATWSGLAMLSSLMAAADRFVSFV
jgi:predicted peroxiredoxin